MEENKTQHKLPLLGPLSLAIPLFGYIVCLFMIQAFSETGGPALLFILVPIFLGTLAIGLFCSFFSLVRNELFSKILFGFFALYCLLMYYLIETGNIY